MRQAVFVVGPSKKSEFAVDARAALAYINGVPVCPATRFAACVLAGLTSALAATGQTLRLPPRPADAPTGRVFAESAKVLDREAREQRIVAEVLRGNVPDFLRRLVPVRLTNSVDGAAHRDRMVRV